MVDDVQLRGFLEETACQVKKNDPVRGRWNTEGRNAKVWVDANYLMLGVTLEMDGCIVEDASWLPERRLPTH